MYLEVVNAFKVNIKLRHPPSSEAFGKSPESLKGQTAHSTRILSTRLKLPLSYMEVRVKQSRHRPGEAQRVPGS